MGYLAGHAAAFALLALALMVPGVAWDALLLRRFLPAGLRAVAFVALSLATWMAVVFALCSIHRFNRTAVLLSLAVLIAGAVAAAPGSSSPSR